MAAFNVELNSRLTQAQTCGELISVVSENVAKFNVVNATTALHKIAKTFRATAEKAAEIQPSLELLLARLTKLLPVSCQPRHLSNTLWACGVLDVDSPELEKVILQELSKQVSRLNPQELANAIYGLGKRSKLGEKGFETAALLIDTSLPSLDSFTPQGYEETSTNPRWYLGCPISCGL